MRKGRNTLTDGDVRAVVLRLGKPPRVRTADRGKKHHTKPRGNRVPLFHDEAHMTAFDAAPDAAEDDGDDGDDFGWSADEFDGILEKL